LLTYFRSHKKTAEFMVHDLRQVLCLADKLAIHVFCIQNIECKNYWI
jgi:ABC-type proline/glycine betaine transport system ATPase subunit